MNAMTSGEIYELQQSTPLLSDPTHSAPERIDQATPLLSKSIHLAPKPEHRNQVDSKIRITDENVNDSSTTTSPNLSKPQANKPLNIPHPKMWNPIWFHKTVLISLASLLAALLVGLGLLCYFSHAHHGFDTYLLQNAYSWKYGPTALFIILSSMWIQVDFWSKVLVPWQEMIKSDASAEKSVLLDYVSSNLVVSGRDAWKNAHWVVVATTVGAGLLELLTILSTALLTVGPITLTNNNFPMLQTTRFARGSLDTAYKSTLALAAYSGILTQGLPHPNGSFANLAYETIEPAQGLPTSNATVTADTVAFFPELNCEVANVSLLGPRFNLNFTDSKCSFEYPYSQDVRCDPTARSCGEKEVSAIWQPLTGPRYNGTVCGDGPDNTRIIFAVIQQDFGKGSDKKNISEVATTMTGAICRPRYSLRPASLTFTGSLANPRAIQSVKENYHGVKTNDTIYGVSNLNLTGALWKLFTMGTFNVRDNDAPNWYDLNTFDEGGMFRLMRAVNNGSSLSAFMDPDTLISTAETCYQGVTSQLARQYLLVGTNGYSPVATVEYVENRLHPVILSVWLTGVGLVLLIGLLVVVLLFRPRDVVPCNPTSMAGILTIMASSKEFNATLSKKIHPGEIPLESCFGGTQIFTNIVSIEDEQSPAFRIEISPNSTSPLQSKAASKGGGPWWKPLPIQIPYFSFATLLPVTLIIILEILQRLSDQNSGFTSISSLRTAQVLANIIPAGVMALVHTMIKSISYDLRLLAPFKTMHKSNAPARRSVLVHHLGAGSVPAIFEAVRAQIPTVVLSATASLLASVLTIVVSALYSSDTVSQQMDITLQRLDSFDLSWGNNNTNLTNVSLAFNLIEHFNMTDAPSTYQDLVFPRFQLSDEHAGVINNAQQSITATVPAYRASLNCTAAARESITAKVNPPLSGCLSSTMFVEPDVNVYAKVPLPSKCLQSMERQNQNNSKFTADVTMGFCFGANSTGWTPMGRMEDINNDSDDCPSLAFAFGVFFANKTGFTKHISTENTTVLACSQAIERVDTITTFVGPDLSIDRRNPPVPDEFKAVSVGNFQYELGLNISINSFDFPGQDSVMERELDRFLQAVIFGPGGISLDELRDTEIATRGIQKTYGQYMAEALNRGMRRSPNTTASSPENENEEQNEEQTSFTASTLAPRDRLKQNATPKLVLQILLGVILLLIAVAWVLAGDLRTVLPHSPCSIAGMLVLIAGSEVLEREVVPKGAEWMGENVWRKQGVFEGWLFSLGWWGGKEVKEVRKRYGINVGRAEG
ncbi:uncharacterized protein BDR25DRAFT_345834 [Lindgomyces ingoldianus]|uniref:Uncharacterized protein n=1 Tax=Lindgomyces ingoldianus TaxID=673940 RepID=A0ACB6QH97_9PLEO|nr:uncharacterized protein BDR25DRAFT_345834 [Lindgomyces ingoldianus]KAF2465938.1 hypothetical protein BDR25DRAFT_345834 [Lindgomyces ingoldianus]